MIAHAGPGPVPYSHAQNLESITKAGAPSEEVLRDRQGRRVSKLRISVTTACDLACTYCRKVGDGPSPCSEKNLAPEEFERIAKAFVASGIRSIRVTGGEPTLRTDLLEIVRKLAGLGVPVGVTTNGVRLAELAQGLREAGASGVNVSLDSLDPETFRRITGSGSLERVLAGIRAARMVGLETKLNVVVLRGINDHEINAFHDLSASADVEVRFLELMRIGTARELFEERFVPVADIIARLSRRTRLVDVPVASDATAFRRDSLLGARLGFIAGESLPFCGSCSRIRLSSTGSLRPCLFDPREVRLAELSGSELLRGIREGIHLKEPARPSQTPLAMHRIGG
jgi:cyclic pyranopterin phosphate synthase